MLGLTMFRRGPRNHRIRCSSSKIFDGNFILPPFSCRGGAGTFRTSCPGPSPSLPARFPPPLGSKYHKVSGDGMKTGLHRYDRGTLDTLRGPSKLPCGASSECHGHLGYLGHLGHLGLPSHDDRHIDRCVCIRECFGFISHGSQVCGQA